jgi:creatinine amidohydrolase/Fe(II)-dependent formamide hydrolase-like protein
MGVRAGTDEPWLVFNLAPESGVSGDPTAATVERWAELFAGAVEAFCVALAEVVRFGFIAP